jgi:hypothetical protein
LTDIHLLTNPPTLDPAYHLLRSAHPDHYGIFLASPTDPPGDIIYGEVQVPGGLEMGRGQKVSPRLPNVLTKRQLYFINPKKLLILEIKHVVLDSSLTGFLNGKERSSNVILHLE